MAILDRFLLHKLENIPKESTCQCKRCEFDPWVGKIPLEKGMAPHSSILTWRIPWTEEPGGVTVHGVTKSQTHLSD